MSLKIGYARVSTDDQKLDQQIDQLVKAGVDERNIYIEKEHGTKRDRPELNRMLSELHEGDEVIIVEISRFSRSTRDLLDIVERIKDKGASIKSLSETWLDTSSDNPSSQLLLTIFAGLVQFERDMISARVKDGLRAADSRGHHGGRPNKRNAKADSVMAMYNGGIRIKDIVASSGLSRATVYRIIRDGKQRSARRQSPGDTASRGVGRLSQISVNDLG